MIDTTLLIGQLRDNVSQLSIKLDAVNNNITSVATTVENSLSELHIQLEALNTHAISVPPEIRLPMSYAPRYSHGHSWECTTIPRSHSICPCPMILSVTAMYGHSWECTTIPRSHSIIMPFLSLLCITLHTSTCITMYFNPNYSWTFSLDIHHHAIINETRVAYRIEGEV